MKRRRRPATSRAELTNRFAQSIARQLDLPLVFEEAIARTAELCNADGSSLILVDQKTGELRFEMLSGEKSKPLREMRLKAGQGVAGQVALEARSQLILNARDAPAFDPRGDEVSGFKTGSIIAVPLINGGDVVGVLQAVRRIGRKPFTQANLLQLEELAPHVTIAVRNSQTREELRELHERVLAANAQLEQKIVERTTQLVNAKTQWERTFDAISEPIALQDGYTILRANVEYARRVRMDIRQVAGKLCHKLLANRDSPCPSCPLIRGRSAQLRAEIEDLDRSILQFSGFWASDAPSDLRVVVHYRDITTERHLTARLRESERLASVGQLASGAAHEINNPIGFMISNLQELRTHLKPLNDLVNAVRDAAAAVKIKDLQQASDALERIRDFNLPDLLQEHGEMVQDSIDGAERVSKIVKALRELARQEVDIIEPSSVTASVTRVTRALLGNHPAIILDLSTEETAEISPLQLDQVLEQLLRNARQAVTADQRITVRTWSTDTQVIIEVDDQGCGIPPDHRPRIFEPFFTTRGIGQGIGLGLTVAYGIVARNGGTIAVQSEVGRGTRVTVSLPRHLRAPSTDPLPANYGHPGDENDARTHLN